MHDLELAAVERKAIGKRRTLWLGFAAVLVPLAVLLGLQYRWLGDLEQSSAAARQATLMNYVETVVKDVEYRYAKMAERTLNLGPWPFKPEVFDKKMPYALKKRFAEVEGVSRLFVVGFQGEHAGKTLLYNPENHSLIPADEGMDEYQALYMAVIPWKVVVKQHLSVEAGFVVEHRDPSFPIVLNPITDENSKIVGLAGMILDPKHFLYQVLPKSAKSALPNYAKEREQLTVRVRNGDGELLFQGPKTTPSEGALKQRAAARHEPSPEEISRNFSFVFTDWTLSLQNRTSTPEQLARANFAFNVTLSAALALALLAGLALALRTASREMRLSEMKNDFVSNVSHELRTPLSSIRVFGEFLRLGRARGEEKVREYGEYIETESRRLTQLIDNILDFSRIESGQKVYHFETCDPGELVRRTLKTFEVRLRHNGFHVEVRQPAPLPAISMDPGAIAQVIANLVDNAVKYSNGRRRITVTLDRRGDDAVIAVSDRGIGISREEQKRIFDRFHRVSSSLVHDVKGNGLGLAIVQHIVQAHGGRVTVESELGEGSTFAVHLLLEGPKGAGATAPEAIEREAIERGITESGPQIPNQGQDPRGATT